jgi:hypothetical protein
MHLLASMLMTERFFQCLEAFNITCTFFDESFSEKRLYPSHIVRR